MNLLPEAGALIFASVGAASTGMWIAAENVPTDSNVAAYLFGGGATVVLAGIVGEVARRLLNGSLIPRVIRDAEIEQGAAIVAAGQREDRMMHSVQALTTALLTVEGAAEATRKHNARIAAELAEVVRKQNDHIDQTFGALSRTIEDLRDEVRDLRRGPK